MTDSAPPRTVWLDIVMVIAVLGWLGAPPILAYGGLIAGAPFLGETPTSAEKALSVRLWTGAAIALVAFPALGLWCASRQRLRGAALLFGLGVAAGLVAAAAVFVLLEQGRSEPPAPRLPGACQEHSGGDTRCPGG